MTQANGKVVKLTKNAPIDKAKVSSQLPAHMASTSLVNYGANTHNGLIRLYNEDRISIVLELKSHSKSQDKRVTYFAIFDGHGGSGCAEFLRDNLHNYIANSSHFPNNLPQALREACDNAETKFM
jgi:protein phosphatase PTC2/3